jgi:hypothetical protein
VEKDVANVQVKNKKNKEQKMSKLYYVTVEYNPETDTFGIGEDMTRRSNPFVWDTDWIINEEEGLEYVPTEEEVGTIIEVTNRLRNIL